ncbi:hypothetical protein D3C81_1713740 [compost metagenome]
MDVQADADRTVGIAGAVEQHEALGPFALVAARQGVVVVAGEIVVADEGVQRRTAGNARRDLQFRGLALVDAGADVVALAQRVVAACRLAGEQQAEGEDCVATVRDSAVHGGWPLSSRGEALFRKKRRGDESPLRGHHLLSRLKLVMRLR